MFGQADTCPQTEDTPMRPQTVYGVSKLAAYEVVRYYRRVCGTNVSCGILYNHESPRRGRQFVTRKISSAVAAIRSGQQTELRLGNLDDRRDWGHARDYVRAMWLMLQQPSPDDYVIATGELHSVREFVAAAFHRAGLDWQEYVQVDPKFYRHARAVPLAGSPVKARETLGWTAECDFSALVAEMVDCDLRIYGNA
jgi:GDPmannose 4,6-dehydratase